MDRRRFMAALTGGVVMGGVSIAARQRYADRFRWNGYDIEWRGWREPANQFVTVGSWSAANSDTWWVATTMGACHRYREFDMIDMSRRHGWPILRAPDDDAKRAACALLLSCLTADRSV